MSNGPARRLVGAVQGKRLPVGVGPSAPPYYAGRGAAQASRRAYAIRESAACHRDARGLGPGRSGGRRAGKWAPVKRFSTDAL